MTIKKEKIINDIIKFLILGRPNLKKEKIPLNKSLLEQNIVDSFGIIELITFLEKKYNISIENEEINYEKFGSIIKMSNLVLLKINKIN